MRHCFFLEPVSVSYDHHSVLLHIFVVKCDPAADTTLSFLALTSPSPPRPQPFSACQRNLAAVANFAASLMQICSRHRLPPPHAARAFSEVISCRRLDEESTSTSQGPSEADLLGVLVAQSDLSDNDITSILFDVVIAGSDTTASTTTAALYVLHEQKNAQWLQRAREEAVVMNAADGVSLEEIRPMLPVATAVAREILRLYPPVPFVGRTATEDSTLCDGKYPVTKGETYCFSPWFLGRDPQVTASCVYLKFRVAV